MKTFIPLIALWLLFGFAARNLWDPDTIPGNIICVLSGPLGVLVYVKRNG